MLNIGDISKKGLKEFSENPIKYSTSSIKDFVLENWDYAAVIVGGIAIPDFDQTILGEYRDLAITTGTAGFVYGFMTNPERAYRNMAAGMGGLFTGWAEQFNDSKFGSLSSHGVAILMYWRSLVFDHNSIGKKNYIKEFFNNSLKYVKNKAYLKQTHNLNK